MLSEVPRRFFDSWALDAARDAYHPGCLTKFYVFVHVYLRYSRNRMSRNDLYELLLSRWEGGYDNAPEMRADAAYFAGLYSTLSDFMKSKAEVPKPWEPRVRKGPAERVCS